MTGQNETEKDTGACGPIVYGGIILLLIIIGYGILNWFRII